MKRTILGTLMCVFLTAGVSAQVQDSIQSEAFHRGAKCHKAQVNRNKRDLVRKMDNKPNFKREGISPEQHAEVRAKFLTEKLSLTTEQGEQLNTIFIKEIESIRNSRTEVNTQNEEAKKEVFKNIKKKTNEQIKQILTEEQYAKYQELNKQHQRHGRPNEQHRPIPHGKHRPYMKPGMPPIDNNSPQDESALDTPIKG